METPTSTGTVTQPAPLKPWKQVAEESNIFSLPPEQRIAEYDKWSAENVAQGIRDGDFDSPDTFSQFKLFDIRTRKNLASDDIIGPSDDEVIADYNSFAKSFQDTQRAFASNKPTPQDEAIQGEVLQGKRNAAFVRGQMVFNPTVVNDPQKYREAILESDAPADIKMFYAGLRPEMEKSATVTRRRELASNVVTRDVADKVVTAIQEGTELFGADIGTPQSPALKKNKDGVWSVVDPEYSDKETSFLGRANAKYNPLADSLYKPFPAINEYQKKYGLTDEQVQQDYMESLIENAPTTVNRWLGKATSIEDYVKQLDSTVRVKNKDVAPEVRVQDPNLFFDAEGYNAAVDKAKAPDEAKTFAKEARTQFADAVAGDIYNNLLNNRDDFRENYAKNVVDRKDMEKAITRYYKDKKDQAWYDDLGEVIGQAGTAAWQGLKDLVMMPSAIKGMFGDVEAAENYRYHMLAQQGEMQAEEAVANRTGGAGFIKLNNDVMRIIPDLVVQMGIAVAAGGTLSGAQASLVAARTGISRAAATTALRQAAITGEKAALKSQLLRIIPEVTASTVDDVAEEVLKASARTMSNNPFKGGIGTQRAVGSAYAGLTSAASTFGQVYTDVVKMGKSPEEAIATARTAGVVAGAITSGLTHSFGMLGRGGVEDFASMGRKAGDFTIKDIVNAGLIDSLTTQEGRQLMRNIAKGISRDALSEGAEEGLDQALNLISQYATNPSPEAQNKKATDIINESLYGGLLGIIAGGGAASVGQARATAPGITAQQMQAEILGAQQPQVSPQTAAPPQQPTAQPPPQQAPQQPVQPPVAPAPIVQPQQPITQPAAVPPITPEEQANYDAAKAVVIAEQNASISLLQRKLRLGYGRAQRMMDLLEQDGVIAPKTGTGSQSVLVQPQAPVVQPSADPAVQEAKTTVESLAEIPDTTQTAAALAALANAAAVPKPEFNLPEIEAPAEPAPEVQLEEEIVTPEAPAPETEAPVNAEETPVEPAPVVAKVETEPTENMKTPARDTTKPEQMTPEEYAADNFAAAKQKFLNSRGQKEGRSVSVIQAEYDQAKIDEEAAKKEVSPYITKDGKGIRKGQEAAILPFQKAMREAKDRREVLEKELRQAETLARDLAIEQRPSTQAREIGYAVGSFRPVSSAAVDAYGITLPPGYVKQGELYVYQPEQKAEVKTEVKAEAVAKPKRPIVGKTGREIMQAWRDLQGTKVMPGENIVGSIIGGGLFAYIGDKIVRLTKAKNGMSVYTDATTKDIDEINDAINKGQFQIESRKVTGLGTYPKLDAGKTTMVLHQATGKPLPEFLDTPEGKAYEARINAAVEKSLGKTKQPQPTKPDAVQKPSSDAGVLRQEGQEVGLPEVDQGGRSAKQEGSGQEGEVKAELTPEQQDVVVFIEQEDEVQEEKQKTKKRITPRKAFRIGIAKQIERLGINSNDPDSVISALEKIAANPPQRHHARIAKDLLAVLKGSGVQIQLVSGNDAKLSEGDSRVNGWYDPKTNTAYINLDGPHELGIEETILHELVHASGEKVIQNPETEAQKRILGDLEKQMLAARKNAIALGQAKMGVDVTDLNMLIDMAASQNDYGLFDILYGVSSLSEYHAHATTSRSFQKFLATYKEGGKRSLFERFVNSITRMLSGVKTAENSDAEKAYATLLDLMREGKGDVRKSNTDTVASEQAVSVTDVVTEPIPKSETEKLDSLPDDATIEDISQASPRLIEQSKALAIKFKDFASWSAAATKAFGSKAARFIETIWTGLKSISIAAIIGYTVTGVDPAFAPSIQEVGKLTQEDAVSASYILPEAPPQQELVAVSISEPAQRPTEIAKPPAQKSKTIEDKITESLSAFDPSVSHYVDFADTEFELEILESVETTAAMKAVAPLIGEMEGNRLSGPNKTLEKVFEVGGIRASQDEIPWCAMFISHGLNKAGTPTRNVMASQFLSFGKKTSTPKTGDVVVFNKRNDDNTISPNIAGHVGFFIRESGDFVLVLNGNVGDGVAVTALPKRRVMQYRSAPAARTDTVQSRARGRFDLVDAVRAASSGDASTPFQALNEAINANAELTRRIQAESERRSRAYARGKGAILEQIIRAGNTGRLPEEAIKPIADFVNSVSPQALADTRISLSAKPQNSTFDFVDSLVTLALNGMGSEPGEIDRTAIHEFWHGLSRFIPDDDIEKIRKDYVAAVKEYISENPWFVAFIGRTHLSEAQYDDLSRMLSKKEMDAIPWKNWETLDDGRRIRGLKWTKENYRLFRLDEWVAETMADLVRRKQERPTTFLGKMARLFRDFIDTLKQALGNPYLKALDAMTVPEEAFDAQIERFGPIEDNPPVMYGGSGVGTNNQFALGMYAGEQALENMPEETRAFKRDSLEAARAMAAAGKTSEEIRAVTGWFPGKYDGKMRWEIPDAEATLRLSEYRKERKDDKSAKEIVREFFVEKQQREYEEATKVIATLKGRDIINYSRAFEAKKKDESTKLYEFYAGSENQEKNRVPLSYLLDHPALFDAYPELRWMPISFNAADLGASMDTVGAYNPSLNVIALNPIYAFEDESKALSTLLHETQHAIQKIEGFAKGGNTSVAAKEIAVNSDAYKYAKADANAAEAEYRKIKTERISQIVKERGSPGALDDLLADTYPEVEEARKKASRLRVGADYVTRTIEAGKVSQEDAFKKYQEIAGEIEARDVQARRDFSAEQRAATEPYSSENIAQDEAIVIFSRARGIVSDTVTKYAPEFNVVDDKDGPSVFFDGRNVTVNPSKLEGLDEYEVKDLAERAVVAAKAAPKDPITADIIQQTDMYDPYNFDSVSRKEIRKSLANAHAVATENGMAPLAMDLGVKLFEYGGATDAEVRKSMARGTASDEEYLAAVEAGDIEKAQRMVDEAAKAAGGQLVFHGGDIEGDVIDVNRRERGAESERRAGTFYASSNPDTAKTYPGKQQRLFFFLQNPFRIGTPEMRPAGWTGETAVRAGDKVISKKTSLSIGEAVDRAKQFGYDGVIYDNIIDTGRLASPYKKQPIGSTYVAFNSNQIKSADPVTRDDNGNVIPLSQRFQSESPDIRYSKARGTELVTYIPRTYSAPRLLLNKLIAGFRSRGMVTEAAYEKFRDSEGFKKANASFISFIAKDYAKVANKYFGEGEESWLDFRVFSRDATGEVTVSKKGFKTPQEAESFAKVSGSKDYIVATGQDLMNKALGSNSHTLKEDVRDKIEKLTKKGLDDIANSIKAYKEEYLNYWNLVMLETQADMVDPNQIATLKERKQQWMKALELRAAEQRKIVDDARKEAVRAALADGTNRIIAQQEFAKAYLPDDLVYQIGRARGKIDELSNQLREIKWLMDGSELEMIIGERLEVYVTRSYEAFETKDRVGYVNWLNEAYQALYQPGKAYDPLAMDRIMPLVRHIKEMIVQRRIEDLIRENEQNQIDDIMAELIADPRQITQVERIPGQPIEGTEYEQLVRAVAKKELETRRSQEKKDFIERAITSLGRTGFASNIGDARKRKVALRKEANRLYEQRYPEQEAVSDIMGAPNPLRWAMMTETEAHDIANVERSLSESPGNVNGSEIWTSSINGLKYSSFMAAVNDDFQKNLDYITGAPASKTGFRGAVADDWKRIDDKILEHKGNIPEFLRTFWGEKDNPLLRVSDTIMKQSHLVAVGELYQNLAKVGKDEGWLVETQVKNSDSKYNDWKPILNSENTDQGYGSNPFKGLYADPVMIGAINTLLAANQPSNTATKVISRIVGLSLWAVTAGSVKAIVRNLSSLGAFLLNSGILSAVLVPSRTIPVLKNVVLAARIMNESMTAVGKVSGGKKIEGKAFQLADKFWTGALAAIAAQRPATAVIKGASSFAQFASRMKENPSSEQAQEVYQLAVKLGVANDNVQKESIQRLLDIEETISRKPVDRNLGKFAKALKLDGVVGFGSYLLGTIKTAGQQRSQLYGAPDDFTKILAWLNEMDAQARIHSKDKAEYNKWRGKDGLFTDMPEEHVRRAANYTTDLIQSHSKVWAHITQFKKMGFGTFIAPFIAARAEFYRNMVNAYRISFAEMRSDIPAEKANGWMRFASALMAHLAYGTMASAVLKMIFRAFADDEEVVEDSQEIRDAIRRLGPEYAKNKSAASVLYKNGTFDWIDISFSNPFAFVWESIYAGRRAASDADVDDFVAWNIARDILGENLGNFVSPQIAVGAGATVISGFDPVRGIKIWDSQADNTAEKVKKATLYYLKQAGLPGDWKSAMNIYNAAKGVEENGRKYKVGTEIAGVFLGASVRTIKVTDMVRQKLSQAKDNLNARITPFYNAQLGDSNVYGPEDFVDAAEKYHKTGQDAIKRMQRVVSAGRVLLAPAPDGEKMLRNVMNSDDVKMNATVERAIMSGKSVPSTLSPQTKQKIGALGKKHDDDRLPITEDTLKRLNQKP